MKKGYFTAACALLAVLTCLLAATHLLRQGSSTEAESTQHVLRVALWDYDTVQYDRRLIQAFEEQNPDIMVEVTSYSPTYYDFSLEALLDSDEQIDVVYANQIPQLASLYRKGCLMPLDDLIERDGVDLSCYSGLDRLRDPATGQLMGLPYRQDKFLLYYNQDLFDQAGLPYPSDKPTWEEVCTLAQQLSARLEGVYGIYLSALPEQLIPQSLDEPFDYIAGDPAALSEGLERYLLLSNAGAAPRFTDLNQMDPAQRLFETGVYGMFLNGSWYLNFLSGDTEQGICAFRWGVAERPASSAGAAENPMMLTPVCIHSETTELEAAWRFLRFVCGVQGAEILVEEMVLPAYHAADIDAQLAARARDFGIDESLVLDGFDPPEAPPSTQEGEVRQAVYALYNRALLGLDPPGDFAAAAAQARENILSP